MDPVTADILIRSRQTILDILDERGYEVTPYRNISPEQILTLAEGHGRALDIFVNKKPDSNAVCDRAVVVYQLHDRIRTKLGTFTRDIYSVPVDSAPHSVVNLGKHDLVPPHRKLTTEEAKELMKTYNVTQKSQFPLIKHNDIQARRLGLVPGEFVEILRPSPTSGTMKFYRICAA